MYWFKGYQVLTMWREERGGYDLYMETVEFEPYSVDKRRS